MPKQLILAFILGLLFFISTKHFLNSSRQIESVYWREQALSGRQMHPLIHQGKGALVLPGRTVSVRSDNPKGPSGIIAFTLFEFEVGSDEPNWLREMGNPIVGARAGAQVGPLTIVEVHPDKVDAPLHPRLMSCVNPQDENCLGMIQELLETPQSEIARWPFIESCLSESVEVCSGIFRALLRKLEKATPQGIAPRNQDILLTMMSVNTERTQAEMRELLLASSEPIARAFADVFLSGMADKPEVLRSLLKSVYKAGPAAGFITQSIIQRLKDRPYERKQMEETLTASGLRWPPAIQEALVTPP